MAFIRDSMLVVATVVAQHMAADLGMFGTCSKDHPYTFQYQGKPAAVQVEDLYLTPCDRQRFIVNGAPTEVRELRTDDGKIVSLTLGSYKVRDAKP